MKNIEIITSQNVTLQYELASLRERILAFVLDTICVVISLSILTAVLGGVFGNSSVAGSILLFLLICIFSLYSLAFEFFNKGRSIGKMAMKIQVIKVVGGQATFSDYAARWVFRLIDIYFSLGGIASILIMSSPKAQRIGDLIAGTAVVKTVPKVNIDLDDLLNIHKTNKYIPKYQQAKKLQERDALLIKTTLERYRKFRNDSHVEAITLLSQRVQEILAIDHIAEEHTVFLQTILQDYVILSR
ncbi:MAG TPA: RDD family protein [Cyclobacteriaceae bacterium]